MASTTSRLARKLGNMSQTAGRHQATTDKLHPPSRKCLKMQPSTPLAGTRTSFWLCSTDSPMGTHNARRTGSADQKQTELEKGSPRVRRRLMLTKIAGMAKTSHAIRSGGSMSQVRSLRQSATLCDRAISLAQRPPATSRIVDQDTGSELPDWRSPSPFKADGTSKPMVPTKKKAAEIASRSRGRCCLAVACFVHLRMLTSDAWSYVTSYRHGTLPAY